MEAVAGLESAKLSIPGQFGWEATCGRRAGLHHLHVHYISISNSTPYILLTWKQRLCKQQVVTQYGQVLLEICDDAADDVSDVSHASFVFHVPDVVHEKSSAVADGF